MGRGTLGETGGNIAALHEAHDRLVAQRLAQPARELGIVVRFEGEAASGSPSMASNPADTNTMSGIQPFVAVVIASQRSSTYQSAGRPAPRGTLKMFPTPRSEARPVPGYHGCWCSETNRMRASCSTSAWVPFP